MGVVSFAIVMLVKHRKFVSGSVTGPNPNLGLFRMWLADFAILII